MLIEAFFRMGAEYQGNDAVRKARGVSQQGANGVGRHDEYQGALREHTSELSGERDYIAVCQRHAAVIHRSHGLRRFLVQI